MGESLATITSYALLQTSGLNTKDIYGGFSTLDEAVAQLGRAETLWKDYQGLRPRFRVIAYLEVDKTSKAYKAGELAANLEILDQLDETDELAQGHRDD